MSQQRYMNDKKAKWMSDWPKKKKNQNDEEEKKLSTYLCDLAHSCTVMSFHRIGIMCFGLSSQKWTSSKRRRPVSPFGIFEFFEIWLSFFLYRNSKLKTVAECFSIAKGWRSKTNNVTSVGKAFAQVPEIVNRC